MLLFCPYTYLNYCYRSAIPFQRDRFPWWRSCWTQICHSRIVYLKWWYFSQRLIWIYQHSCPPQSFPCYTEFPAKMMPFEPFRQLCAANFLQAAHPLSIVLCEDKTWQKKRGWIIIEKSFDQKEKKDYLPLLQQYCSLLLLLCLPCLYFFGWEILFLKLLKRMGRIYQ